MDSFRKAYGALKDSTTVGLAKVNSNFKDLDIAIVKATNHVECPPKERHVRQIFAAVSASSPRPDVGYCVHALSKRFSKTQSWIVAIKSLIVFHRILREGDLFFREELARVSIRGRLFDASNFNDDSSTLAWDCSSWIRSYAVYLEERLESFENFNLEKESSEYKQEESKTRVSNVEELLEEIPPLQQLLYRLLCCQPERSARHNYLVQYALAMIIKESFKIYCTVNDGLIMLVDMYFDMTKEDAVAALKIYRRAGRQTDYLAKFYDLCKTLDLARTFQFPILRQPPSSFIATMEEYIKESPERGSPSCCMHEQELHKVEEIAAPENAKTGKETANTAQETVLIDLLGLNEESPKTTQPEKTNTSALAICEPANDQPQAHHGSGWELALVTAPSSTNQPQNVQPKGGGFDKLLLDSLYDDDVARRQLELRRAGYSAQGYGYGYGYQNPMMQQQQQYGMMAPKNHHQNPYASQTVPVNPFGDPFSYRHTSVPPRGNPRLF